LFGNIANPLLENQMSKANQAVAPAQSAIPATTLETVCGKTLVEAQASLEEIFLSTANAEKQMVRGEEARDAADALLLDWVTQWHEVDGKMVKMRKPKTDVLGNPVLEDGKPIMVYVPISYPEYKQVLAWGVAKYYDAGAPTVDAAERQVQRQFQRLLSLDWVRPTAKNADAERVAKRRAAEAAKYAEKSDGELAELADELVKTGTVAASKERTNVLAEIARREKPQLDAAQSQRVAVRDKLIARAKELCKAGTADADEKLIAALQALA
jgi:hypothetical protein